MLVVRSNCSQKGAVIMLHSKNHTEFSRTALWVAYLSESIWCNAISNNDFGKRTLGVYEELIWRFRQLWRYVDRLESIATLQKLLNWDTFLILTSPRGIPR